MVQRAIRDARCRPHQEIPYALECHAGGVEEMAVNAANQMLGPPKNVLMKSLMNPHPRQFTFNGRRELIDSCPTVSKVQRHRLATLFDEHQSIDIPAPVRVWPFERATDSRPTFSVAFGVVSCLFRDAPNLPRAVSTARHVSKSLLERIDR